MVSVAWMSVTSVTRSSAPVFSKGLSHTLYTGGSPISVPATASYIKMEPFLLPTARALPSGLKRKVVTWPTLARNMCSFLPVSTESTLIRRSPRTPATRSPLGLSASWLTPSFSSPSRMSTPVSTSHKEMPCSPPWASSEPSGENATSIAF